MKSIVKFENKKLVASNRFKGGSEKTVMGDAKDRKRKNGTIITYTDDWNPFNNDRL